MAEALTERGDATEVLAFLLKSHYSKPAAAPASEQAKARADKTRKSKPAKTQAPKEDRSEAPPPEPSPYANLYVSLGRDNGLNELTDLMDALAGIAGVDPAQFTGAGNLRDHSSHIEVDKEISEKVKDSINGKNYPENLRSEKLEADAVMVCDFARPKRRRPSNHRRGPRNRR